MVSSSDYVFSRADGPDGFQESSGTEQPIGTGWCKPSGAGGAILAWA